MGRAQVWRWSTPRDNTVNGGALFALYAMLFKRIKENKFNLLGCDPYLPEQPLGASHIVR
jgi:hypothetical protein